jgi:hypothetical protein
MIPNTIQQARSFFARSRGQALQANLDVLRSSLPLSDAHVGQWVDALPTTVHVHGPFLPEPWMAAILDADIPQGRRLDAVRSLARAVPDAPHRGGLLQFFRHSEQAIRTRADRATARERADYVIGAAVRAVDSGDGPIREALRDALDEWTTRRMSVGPSAVYDAVDAFVTHLISRVTLSPMAWRRLFAEVDGAFGSRAERWPTALSASLRCLYLAADRHRILHRLRPALADMPSLYRLIAVQVVTNEATGFAQRQLAIWPTPITNAQLSEMAPDDLTGWLRDAIAEAHEDAERHETDPVQDAAAALARSMADVQRADEWTSRHRPQLSELHARVAGGLTPQDSAALGHAMYATCGATLSAPSELAFATVIRDLLDACPHFRTRGIELGAGLAQLLDESPDVTRRLRMLRTVLDRSRRVPHGLANRASRGSAFQFVGDLTYGVIAAGPGMVGAALDGWTLRGPDTDDLQGVLPLVRSHSEALGEGVCASLEQRAPGVSTGLELGRSLYRATALAADIASQNRAEHDRIHQQYAALLRELAWVLLDGRSDAAAVVWEEWSNDVGTSLDEDGARTALVALRAGLEPVMTPGSAHRVFGILQQIFEDHLGIVFAPEAPSLAPFPYRVGPQSGGRWTRAFGETRAHPDTTVSPFATALSRSCDPEVAALHAGTALNETTAWHVAHADIAERGQHQILIADALQPAAAADELLALFAPLGLEPPPELYAGARTWIRRLRDGLRSLPLSLVALEGARYLLVDVLPDAIRVEGMNGSIWRLFFARLAASIDVGSAPWGTWTRLCDSWSAMSDDLARLGWFVELMSDEEPVFSEVHEEERAWRGLFASIVAIASLDASAPIAGTAFVERLVLADTHLAKETPDSWADRAEALSGLVQGMAGDAFAGAFLRVCNAVKAGLEATSEPSTPLMGCTPARLLSGLDGAHARWTSDLLGRSQSGQRLRDPADVAVSRATGWPVPDSEQLTRDLARLTEVSRLTAPESVGGGGLFGFLRSKTVLEPDVRDGLTRWLRVAGAEDVLGVSDAHRRRSLTRLVREYPDAPIGPVLDVVLPDTRIEDRSEAFRAVQMGVQLDPARGLAELWLDGADANPPRRDRCIADLALLLKRVQVYALGASPIPPEEWYARHVLPYLVTETRAQLDRILAAATRVFAPVLGESATTLGESLAPIKTILQTRESA